MRWEISGCAVSGRFQRDKQGQPEKRPDAQEELYNTGNQPVAILQALCRHLLFASPIAAAGVFLRLSRVPPDLCPLPPGEGGAVGSIHTT